MPLPHSPLEVCIDKVYRSGLAYFKVGEVPYMRERDGKVHKASNHDYHPMLTQFDYESPLAETGKKFASVEDAVHYVLAITEFEKIITLAEAGTIQGCSPTLKEELDRLLEVQQKIVHDKYLETLREIPSFDKVRLLLHMKIEGIPKYIDHKRRHGE